MVSHWGLGFQQMDSRGMEETHAQSTQVKFTFILQLIIGHYTSSCLHQDTLLIFSICSYSVSPEETRIVSPDILKCILGCQARTG